jgi:multidrug transporter EmrE-like cation transporter
MKVFLAILGLTFIEFLGDSSIKLYTRGGSKMYLLSGILSYALILWSLIYVLKFSNVAFMNLEWDGISTILETLLAFIVLRETLSNRSQYMGMIFIILGVILLNQGKVPV